MEADLTWVWGLGFSLPCSVAGVSFVVVVVGTTTANLQTEQKEKEGLTGVYRSCERKV